MTEETPPGLQVVSPCAKISLNVFRQKTVRKLVGKLSSCMHFMASLVYTERKREESENMW